MIIVCIRSAPSFPASGLLHWRLGGTLSLVIRSALTCFPPGRRLVTYASISARSLADRSEEDSLADISPQVTQHGDPVDTTVARVHRAGTGAARPGPRGRSPGSPGTAARAQAQALSGAHGGAEAAGAVHRLHPHPPAAPEAAGP